MIVFGTRMYGRVDETTIGHVATRFFHIWFLPLFPIKSFLVTREDGREFHGVPLPMSGRSVLAGYARAWGILLLLGCGLFFLYHLIFRFGEDIQIYIRGGTAVREADLLQTGVELAMLLFGVVLGAIAFFGTRGLKTPSSERCAELSRMLGVEVVPANPPMR